MSKKKQKGISIRVLIPMVAVVLLLGCAIGGTIAWLTAQTDPVTNTFTVGKLHIQLWEGKYDSVNNKVTSEMVTKNEYKIIPGKDLPKDPTLTVRQTCEPCWLFVKVEEVNFIDGLSYEIDVIRERKDADGNPEYSDAGEQLYDGIWTQLEGYNDVYYLEFTPDTYPNVFNEAGVVYISEDLRIFAKNKEKIYVSGEITKEQLNAINGTASLNFTAYAIQHDGFATAAAAWEVLNSTYNIVPTTAE